MSIKKLLTNHILFQRQSELHINLTIFFCFVKPLSLGLGLGLGSIKFLIHIFFLNTWNSTSPFYFLWLLRFSDGVNFLNPIDRMNRQESRGNISSVQAHWSSRAVNYSIGSCFWLGGYEIGIASSYQARAHGTTVKYSAHIIISIYSNCTKDKGSLITAYVHFLGKTTELKKMRGLRFINRF